jgi:hypothetical protein
MLLVPNLVVTPLTETRPLACESTIESLPVVPLIVSTPPDKPALVGTSRLSSDSKLGVNFVVRSVFFFVLRAERVRAWNQAMWTPRINDDVGENPR